MSVRNAYLCTSGTDRDLNLFTKESKLNKLQLADQIADRCGITNAEAGRMITAFTETVSSALAGGDSVTLVGFGIFETKQRAARNGRNPTTGEPVHVPAKRIPKFRPGAKLLEAVAE